MEPVGQGNKAVITIKNNYNKIYDANSLTLAVSEDYRTYAKIRLKNFRDRRSNLKG
jgi:hypothetical protein